MYKFLNSSKPYKGLSLEGSANSTLDAKDVMLWQNVLPYTTQIDRR